MAQIFIFYVHFTRLRGDLKHEHIPLLDAIILSVFRHGEW